MDYEGARFWFGIAQALLTAGVWIYVYVSNRARVTRERFERLEKEFDGRMDRIESRTICTEATLNHAPSHTDLAAIYDKINAVAQTVSILSGEMKAVTRALSRVEQHLLSERPGNRKAD